MALDIDGVTYVHAAEVAKELGISRQTLWRWRQEGKIPAGHRFRGRQVLFTEAECEAVRSFATRVEPIESHRLDRAELDQLRLFDKRYR